MNPVVWSDMMRWWALGGAVLGIFPLARSLRRHAVVWLTAGPSIAMPPLRLAIEKLGLLLLLSFVIIAGTVIPLTSRIDGFTADSAAFLMIMATAWTAAGIGAWASAAAFSNHRFFTTASSLTWFVAVSFAITATAG